MSTEKEQRRTRVSFDQHSLIYDFKRHGVRSAAMHYFRLPSEDLWWDRLSKLKAADYNTVDLYFWWGYHSVSEKSYDFSGVRDVALLLQMTQDLGLNIIARPGPYINAEVNGGGFPEWLLKKAEAKELVLRNRKYDGTYSWSQPYMNYVTQWWYQIMPFLRGLDNLILIQVENEYATNEVETYYLEVLSEMTHEMGIKAPILHNDMFAAGLYKDVVDIYAVDLYPVTSFDIHWQHTPSMFNMLDHLEANLRPMIPEKPLAIMEFQTGWFSHWKSRDFKAIEDQLDGKYAALLTKSAIAQGVNIFSHYMAVGATNWGAVGSTDSISSYDFGAPIKEDGTVDDKYSELRLINYFLKDFDLLETRPDDKLVDRALFQVSDREVFYKARRGLQNPGTWVFFRNWSKEAKTFRISNRFPVTINPWEMMILPYEVKLKNGYVLQFSSVELIAQTETLMLVKGDKAVYLEIRSEDSSWVRTCKPLRPMEHHVLQAGKITIVVLGEARYKALWKETDGSWVCGPQMRWLDADKKLISSWEVENASSSWLKVTSQGFVQEFPIKLPPAASLPLAEAIKLSPWERKPFLSLKPAEEKPLPKGLHSGLRVYKYTPPIGFSVPKVIRLQARHIWALYCNGQFLKQGEQFSSLPLHQQSNLTDEINLETIPEFAEVWQHDKANTFTVVVDDFGRSKGFHDDAQYPNGLVSLKMDAREVEPVLTDHHVMDLNLPITKNQRQKVNYSSHMIDPTGSRHAHTGLEDFPKTWIDDYFLKYQQTLTCLNSEGLRIPLAVCVDKEDLLASEITIPDRINIYVNDLLVGRYWHACGQQTRFVIPEYALKMDEAATNIVTLELYQMGTPFDPVELVMLLGAIEVKPISHWAVLTQ